MSTSDDERRDGEVLPFDVELERLPTWAHVSSAIVIVLGLLVAARLVNVLLLLPFLIASSVGRRFGSVAMHVEVDADGIDLGGREISRSEILDVWVDDTDPRATVAFGADVELAVLYFENREQARRFGEALAAKDESQRTMVVGHKPRPVDALASLRFVAIALSFIGTGAWVGLFILVFFAFGASAFLRAKQLIARAQGFQVRSVLGARTYAYAEVESVDVDAGVIHLKDGAEISLPRSALRDTTLASNAWLERARSRVLARIRTSRA